MLTIGVAKGELQVVLNVWVWEQGQNVDGMQVHGSKWA